ncbi:MAG: cupin domain-containing protein [Myxococcales bacterium]|nr:cupin domain-containing protein [Myxococcales bacterium]
MLGLFGAFLLGACATTAVQSAASTASNTTASVDEPQGETAPVSSATVVALADAPRAISPNGKGSITHLARGQNAYLGMLRMAGGGAVPTHRDPTEEYIHVLAGGGTMIIDGVSYEVTTGTTVYMPADAEVSFQNGPEELVAIQVFAGPEPAAKYETWTRAD